MNQARIIYHLARADFLERVRSYSFLVMLGTVVFLGYRAAIGFFIPLSIALVVVAFIGRARQIQN